MKRAWEYWKYLDARPEGATVHEMAVAFASSPAAVRAAMSRSGEHVYAVGTTERRWFSSDIWAEPRPIREPHPRRRGRRPRRWTGECVYCGSRAQSLDHTVPAKRGLPTTLVPSCSPCNLAKGNRTPEEWLARLARVTDQPHLLDAAAADEMGLRSMRSYLHNLIRIGRLRTMLAA